MKCCRIEEDSLALYDKNVRMSRRDLEGGCGFASAYGVCATGGNMLRINTKSLSGGPTLKMYYLSNLVA